MESHVEIIQIYMHIQQVCKLVCLYLRYGGEEKLRCRNMFILNKYSSCEKYNLSLFASYYSPRSLVVEKN